MSQVLVGEELKQKTWYLKDVGYFCVCKEPYTLFKANMFIFLFNKLNNFYQEGGNAIKVL